MCGGKDNEGVCQDNTCRYCLPGGKCVLDLVGQDGMTQAEVAELMGISRTRIWQIEQKALNKIKAGLVEHV